MTAAATLDRDAIAAVDEKGQLDDILALPDHLRDALWRVESADLEPRGAVGGLIVTGMGGSAIGGALARAALGDRALRRLGQLSTRYTLESRQFEMSLRVGTGGEERPAGNGNSRPLPVSP